MGLKKGMTNNRKGRPAGKPNRISSDLKSWVSALLDDNRQVFENDLKKLDPPQRLNILEKLLAYSLPRLQALDAKSQIELQFAELERLLKSTPDEFVQRIADKVLELSELSKQK